MKGYEIMRRRNWIVLGDPTTHAGTVVTAWGWDAPYKSDVNGKWVVCIGDKVICPRCKGVHTIIGDPSVKNRPMIEGRPVALEGDYVSDGSRLISAGQSMQWVEDDSEGSEVLATAVATAAAAMSNVTPPPAAASGTSGGYGSGGTGGLIKAGFFGASPPRMSDKAFEANMCEWACGCLANRPPDLPPKDKGGTDQSCVNKKIREQYYDSTNHPRDDSPVWSEVSFRKYDSTSGSISGLGVRKPDYRQYDLVMSENYPGKPSSAPIVSDSWRLDVVKIGSNGKPEKFYDMKFGEDDPTFKGERNRLEAYRAIAEKHTGSTGNYVTFDVEKRCGCNKRKEETQTQQAPKKSWFERFNKKPDKPINFPPGGDSGKPAPPVKPPVILPPLPGMPPIKI